MSGEWSTHGGGAETPSSSDFTCNLQWGRRIVNLGIYVYFFRPCFFSEAKKAKERFKVVVVGGVSDRWASRTSVYP